MFQAAVTDTPLLRGGRAVGATSANQRGLRGETANRRGGLWETANQRGEFPVLSGRVKAPRAGARVVVVP